MRQADASTERHERERRRSGHECLRCGRDAGQTRRAAALLEVEALRTSTAIDACGSVRQTARAASAPEQGGAHSFALLFECTGANLVCSAFPSACADLRPSRVFLHMLRTCSLPVCPL